MSRVVSIFLEYAVAPDALQVSAAKAEVTAKGTLEVTADVGAREGGVVKRALVSALTVSVPATGAKYTVRPGDAAVFEDGKEVDLAAVKAAGSVDVRFTASLSYTDSAYKRKTLSLGADKTLPVKSN